MSADTGISQPPMHPPWARVIARRRDGRWRVIATCCERELAISEAQLVKQARDESIGCYRCRDAAAHRRSYGLRPRQVGRHAWWPLSGWGERG